MTFCFIIVSNCESLFSILTILNSFIISLYFTLRHRSLKGICNNIEKKIFLSALKQDLKRIDKQLKEKESKEKTETTVNDNNSNDDEVKTENKSENDFDEDDLEFLSLEKTTSETIQQNNETRLTVEQQLDFWEKLTIPTSIKNNKNRIKYLDDNESNPIELLYEYRFVMDIIYEKALKTYQKQAANCSSERGVSLEALFVTKKRCNMHYDNVNDLVLISSFNNNKKVMEKHKENMKKPKNTDDDIVMTNKKG